MCVHSEHCCEYHGCKYNEKDCPVVKGRVKGISCEYCGEDMDISERENERSSKLVNGNKELVQILSNGIKEFHKALMNTQSNPNSLPWKPFSECTIEHKMAVFIAVDAIINAGSPPYTSDPYCGWLESDGSITRWPHKFNPTHFFYIEPPRKGETK